MLCERKIRLFFLLLNFFYRLATAATPYLTSLWSLCLALFFQGMLHGLSDLGLFNVSLISSLDSVSLAINTVVTSMWADRCTAPLNLVYFGYALGALLSLSIVQLFRSISAHSQLQLELIGPYTTASIFCLLCSIGFAIIALKQKKRSHRREADRQPSVRKIESLDQRTFWYRSSPTTCGEGYYLYGFVLLFLLIMFHFCFGKFFFHRKLTEKEKEIFLTMFL